MVKNGIWNLLADCGRKCCPRWSFRAFCKVRRSENEEANSLGVVPASRLNQSPTQLFVCSQGGDPSFMSNRHSVGFLHQGKGIGIAGQALEV